VFPAARFGEAVMRVEGGCHCGAIAYEAEVDGMVRVCHCTDCQTMSGSLFRANITAPPETFRLLRGTPKTYVKTADSGTKRAQAFCGDCGTGLWATAPEGSAPYGLRVGTIRQRASFTPTQQIWCQSELPWTAAVSGLARREQG